MMGLTTKGRLRLKWLIVTSGALFALVLCTDAHAAAEAPDVDLGATAWMLTSTALVLLMVPGLATAQALTVTQVSAAAGALTKVRLMIAVNDSFVEPTCEAIVNAARADGDGTIGDGKIFVTPLEECIRIRTSETGGKAI